MNNNYIEVSVFDENDNLILGTNVKNALFKGQKGNIYPLFERLFELKTIEEAKAYEYMEDFIRGFHLSFLPNLIKEEKDTYDDMVSTIIFAFSSLEDDELLFGIEVRIYYEISFKDFKDKIHYIVNYFDPDIVGIVAEDSDDIDDEGLGGEFPHVFFHYTTDDLED